MKSLQLPIIILVDDITHTPEWPQCKDPTCPCQLEGEDEIADVLPSEAELDAQEQTCVGRSIDWSKIFDDGPPPAPRYFGDTLASRNNE